MANLFYVMGPSGAGKDSVLTYARQHFGPDDPVAFVHRYITRDAESGSENHVALTEQEFAGRLSKGLFAMHWESHGLHYGIGIEIEQWLEKGMNVVINGSREYLEVAAQKYPKLRPVLVTVSLTVLRQRLLVRGRESAREISKRIHRASMFNGLRHNSLVFLDNSGPLHEAGNHFIQLIKERETVCS